MFRLALLVGAAISITACDEVGEEVLGVQEYSVDDDVGSITLDWDRRDDIAAPYVLGSEITFRAAGGWTGEDWTGWTIAVDDESVFQIDERSETGAALWVKGVAAGEGETEIHLIDPDGEIAHSASLAAAMPDRAELHAHGPQYVGREDLDDVGGERRLLSGGTATFEVRYFQDAQALAGDGVLVAAGDGVELEPDASSLGEDREWLRVTPDGTGERSVQLQVFGAAFDTFDFVAVDETAVTGLALYGEPEPEAGSSDTLYVMAWLTDGEGRPVHGGEVAWSLGGDDEEAGDLFWYGYEHGGIVRDLEARFYGLEAEIEISALRGQAASSEDVGVAGTGCSAVGGGASVVGVGLVLVGLARRRGRAGRAERGWRTDRTTEARGLANRSDFGTQESRKSLTVLRIVDAPEPHLER